MPVPVPTELIESARDGGPAQIERLLEAIWPDAYRFAHAILGERQGAEDAAQEACIISCTGRLRHCAASPRFACGSIASSSVKRRHSGADGPRRDECPKR